MEGSVSDSYSALRPFLLDRPRPGQEHENKFLAPADDAALLLEAAQAHLPREIHDTTRPIAYTRTTYLDNDGLDYFRSSSESVARRLRIREYASAADLRDSARLTGACFLELKESSGQLRSKQRIAAAPEQVWDIVGRHRRTLPRLPGASLSALRAVRECLRDRGLAARVTTWYRRTSLGNVADGVRVTIDEGLRFYRPAHPGRVGDLAEPQELLGKLDACVIEVKTSIDTPRWLLEAMSGLREAHGLSKFKLGMLAVTGAWPLARLGRDHG